MNNVVKRIIFTCITSLGLTGTICAAPVTLSVSATIEDAIGTYATMSAGQTVNGLFTYDTDEANADYINTTPGTTEGHEFTSFYEFYAAVYGVSLSFPDATSFENYSFTGVVVNDDLAITAEDTNGLIADGTYDWIEIFGSTASDVAGPNTPGNGEEWTLAIFADDANWFTDGSLIPDTLPGSYTAIIIGVDLDSNGDEIGFLSASVDSVTVTSVPVPAAVWLFGSGLLGLVGVARRKRIR